MDKRKILVVEDEFITGTEIKKRLQNMGYDVPKVVATGEDAIRLAGEFHPDIVVMDITLKGEMNGITAAEEIRKRYDIPVVFLTAHSDDATVEKAVMSEPFGYLIKPLDERALRTTIQMALYKHAMDEKLKERDRVISALLNTTADAMLLLDSEGNILGVNQPMAERLNRKPDDLHQMTINDLLSAGTITIRMAEEERTVHANVPAHFVEEFQNRWYENTLYPITNLQGTVTKIAVYSHDITSIKATEKRLAELIAQLSNKNAELTRFTAALNGMDDMVIITNHSGNIDYVNATFEKKFGYTAAEVKGKHISDLAAPGNQFAITKDRFIDDLKQKAVWTGNFYVKNKFGVRFYTALKSNFLEIDAHTFYRVFVLREQM